MKTNNEDEMLKKFFSENKTEIANNGFSKKVMQKIPQERTKEWIVGVFTMIGIGLAGYLAIPTGLINAFLVLFTGISIYYLLIAVFIFPLITFLVLILQKNRYLGLRTVLIRIDRIF